MSFERGQFEAKGLKLDKDRVLTYSQLSCPLDCRYCFVNDLNFNQKRKVAYLSEEQHGLLEALPDEVRLLMLGCDTEFFQNKKESLQILDRLIRLKKDISVITKLPLTEAFIRQLAAIAEQYRQQGNVLAFSVSLPCFESADFWEPRVPSPARRVRTLRCAYENGLRTLVAMRPLLPTVTDQELERIVLETKDYCYGYYAGPLFLKNLDLLEPGSRDGLNISEVQPHWMPEGNIFYHIERQGQSEFLREIVRQQGRPFFEGAADGINYLKTI